MPLVRVWVRVRVSFRVGGGGWGAIFLGGNCPRTVSDMIKTHNKRFFLIIHNIS